MKIQLAYKFSGEDEEKLVRTLTRIAEVLENSGHEVYFACKDEDLFRKNNFTPKQILVHALKKLDDADCLLVFVRSKEKAEGILIETGYAIAMNKKIILAIKKGIMRYFTGSIANQIIEFEDIDDLIKKLEQVK